MDSRKDKKRHVLEGMWTKVMAPQPIRQGIWHTCGSRKNWKKHYSHVGRKRPDVLQVLSPPPTYKR